MQTEQIKSALTAEEWAWLKQRLSAHPSYALESFAEDEHDPFKVAAAAIFALPDDDPRKITRADVEELQSLYNWLVEEVSTQGAKPIAAIAAKLAALLPPELREQPARHGMSWDFGKPPQR